MSSGNKQMVLNTRERLVSDDHNRLQAFIGADLASVLSHLLLATADADASAAGSETLPSTNVAPMAATVLNGLRPLPINGTANLLVEAGVLVMANPDTPVSGDDVPQKWVVDPGVQIAGQLTLAPGAGSTRIDVVECSRTTAVVESDNRDIFNPSTGLFSPVLVDKVVVGRLAYRIRAGTPGAGFPGVVAGWLPLAVCSVPSAATTWDAVAIWDVRPLAADRWGGPFATTVAKPRRGLTHVFTDASTAPGELRLLGNLDLAFGAYRAGGKVTSDAGDYLDVAASAIREPGYAVPSSGWWHLWLAFPFGLPRWARYTPASSGSRVPSGLRGVPVLSTVAARYDGTVRTGSIALPTATGLGGTTTSAVLAASGRTDSTPKLLGISADGLVFRAADPALASSPLDSVEPFQFTYNIPANANVNTHFGGPAVTDNSYVLWDHAFVDGTTHPPNAKAIWVVVAVQFVGSYFWTATPSQDATFTFNHEYTVSGPDGDLAKSSAGVANLGQDVVSITAASHTSYGPFGYTIARAFRVPLPPPVDPTVARQFSLKWWIQAPSLMNGGWEQLHLYSPQATVFGWEV